MSLSVHFFDVFIQTNWISRDLHLACEDAPTICAGVHSAGSVLLTPVGEGPGEGKRGFS